MFSFGKGIIHPYYTIALGPAVGAVVGIGARDALVAPRPCSRSARSSRVFAATVVWSYSVARPHAELEPVAARRARGRRVRRARRVDGVAVPPRARRARGGGRRGRGRLARSGRVHGGDRGDSARRCDPVGRARRCRRGRAAVGSGPAAFRAARPVAGRSFGGGGFAGGAAGGFASGGGSAPAGDGGSAFGGRRRRSSGGRAAAAGSAACSTARP